MSFIKIIKTADDHAQAIEHLMVLMDAEPKSGSEEENELDVLALLIEQYEIKKFPMDKPSPIEAIQFRMDQQGLTRKDLIPFIGSAPKVSEVLNGKRSLSLSMIRKLHKGLAIPADVLIQEPEFAAEVCYNPEADIQWDAFPLKEMQSKGYFGDSKKPLKELKLYAEDLVRGFFKACPVEFHPEPMMMRSTAHFVDNDKQVDPLAIQAWQGKVLKVASEQDKTDKYQQGTVTEDFMRRLVQESWSDNGPLIAKEYLAKHGIDLVIESHLPKTYLDGAVCFKSNGNPVIALTLRHDRVDSFWFSLMHELAHIALHFDGSCDWMLDDFDAKSGDVREDEANAMARDVLIPASSWNLYSGAELSELTALAKLLNISPQIVYGRFGYDFDQWPKVRRHLKKVSPLFAL
ncbi:MAG: ImmA/IrrE family metallo-endopeptidase [Pseudomonadales bacterium]|nr:ImmA/IrrE family metallo-endopeptidase [Pseudomonadales bacterium]